MLYLIFTWQNFLVENVCDSASWFYSTTCLGHLGQCSTHTIGSSTLATGFLAKILVTVTDILLALATFGEMTQLGSFLLLSLCPRWPRQIQMCHCCCSMSLLLALSRYFCKCKYSLFVLSCPRGPRHVGGRIASQNHRHIQIKNFASVNLLDPPLLTMSQHQLTIFRP